MRVFLSRLFGRREDPATRRLGRAGERLAARTLRRAGYRVIGKNLRAPMGEADLLCIAPDRRTIVLVEVKTRVPPREENPLSRPPEAAVHALKQVKLRAILAHLVRANRWKGRPARIDVVAIDWPREGGKPVVRHHVGVVALGRAQRGAR